MWGPRGARLSGRGGHVGAGDKSHAGEQHCGRQFLPEPVSTSGRGLDWPMGEVLPRALASQWRGQGGHGAGTGRGGRALKRRLLGSRALEHRRSVVGGRAVCEGERKDVGSAGSFRDGRTTS